MEQYFNKWKYKLVEKESYMWKTTVIYFVHHSVVASLDIHILPVLRDNIYNLWHMIMYDMQQV